MASLFTSRRFLRQATTIAAVTVTGSLAVYTLWPRRPLDAPVSTNPPKLLPITPRSDQLAALRHSTATPDAAYDLLVIGGGATGTGIALDAATRGLKVALVERDDFASGTSSKSTKLVHGGVRYLEKAIKELDYEQYKLVCAALRERRCFLDIAPHLSQALPLLLPIRRWWEAPYLWIGTKLYDLLAGSEGLKSSYFLPRAKALQAFPTLDASQLVGGLIYYDGQHNDARMNVTLAMTAAAYGATVVNHVEVTSLEKDQDGKVCGVRVRNGLVGGDDDEEFVVRARGVINATGPFADQIHHLDEPSTRDIVMPSSGVHIVLPEWIGPKDVGLIDPSSDGRVIFLLPWQGKMVAGTTDRACGLDPAPIPEEEDVNWILEELKGLLSPDVNLQRSDVLATWSGIRPLVRDPSAKNTEALTRSHLITVSDSGLLTCVGGKWTTFREMAEDTVDTAISVFNLNPLKDVCQTRHVRLVGAHGYSPTLATDLSSRFRLTADVSDHLAHSYGDRAWEVASLSSPADEPSHRVAGPAYPYLDGEVRYAVRSEYALTAADVLARRTRLAFLDVQAALDALPNVIAIMAEELKWDDTRKKDEFSDTVRFLRSMGLTEEVADALVS
ncbi:mitochondrial glycerol-3-phosphate dehydrogenase [Lipomyces kononenkoae]|uniref:Mitochondrial glycerol-3-phosphate dehydrogenase n=1 Tax=Lipomyces kononenkoae TaxID=34357 RepID=A0ACC3ST79_LIPKO